MTKILTVGNVNVQVPDELEMRARRLASEVDIPRIPDLPPLRRVLDLGAGAGVFGVYAYLKWSGAYIDAYDAHPRCIDFLKRNLPAGSRITHSAIGTGGEIARVTIRNDHTIEVPLTDPRELAPCDVIRINLGGREQEAYEHYKHWDGVKVAIIEWHHEVPPFVPRGMRRLRAIWYRNDRGVEVWARTRAVFNEREGRFVLPKEAA